MTVKWSLLLFLLVDFIEIEACPCGRQTSSVLRVLSENEDRSKFSLFTQSLKFIIHVYSSQDFCVDYRGVHFKIGESGSIDGCNNCLCRDMEGRAEWGCTK